MANTNTSLAGQDLSGRDLRGYDFRGCALYGTDLRGSNLHGCSISIDCATFHGAKLDRRQLATLLLLMSQADIVAHDRQVLVDAARRIYDGFEELRSVMRVANV